MQKKIYCIISHTHWDREWYYTFEHFRMKLVDLFNNLLSVLEKYPEYIFHLDAQTIVIEDYLEICPYNRTLIMKYIKNGNLIVGPWYVQNDFYLTDGESTIRNLLVGSKMAEEMGCFMKIGYIPDQFGNISQLPQIFNGFDIKNCFFGRGYSFYEENDNGVMERIQIPAGFKWAGKDGSEVLNIRFSPWYNNAQRLSENMQKTLGIIDIAVNKYQGQEQTPYYLFMNGVDHLEAQENLIPIIEKVNSILPDGHEMRQYTMQKYFEDFRGYIAENKVELATYMGELRNGNDYELLKGTISSRINLKIMNVKLQNLLEKSIEPLYAMVEMIGFRNTYPADFMWYLWKLLMQNHPHDSICGCSVDLVHEHMVDRFKRVEEVGVSLVERGMELLGAHMTRSGMRMTDYLIVLCNTSMERQSETVDIVLEFPSNEQVNNFDIFDENENDIPYYVTEKYMEEKRITSAINLPGLIEMNCYRLRMLVPPMKGISVRRLIVRPKAGNCAKPMIPKPVLEYVLENKHVKAVIHKNGKMDLTYKKNMKTYYDILTLSDSEDCGNSYVYHNKGLAERPDSMDERFKTFCSDNANLTDPLEDSITTRNLMPQIENIADNPVEQICRLTYMIDIPESFDTTEWKRSVHTTANKVEIYVSLKRDSRYLETELHIHNRSRDHRLRLHVNTGLETDYTYSMTPFDVIKRDRREVLKGIQNGTQPNSGFVTVTQNNDSLTILNEGVYEYEHLLNGPGTIAMTVLRSCALMSRIKKQDVRSDMFQPGNQCLGEYAIRLALYPHEGDYIQGNVTGELENFQNKVLSFAQGYDPRKFSGGRPAVQDTDIAEIFFRNDPHQNNILPKAKEYLCVEGEGVAVSAVKKAQEQDLYIVRIYNMSDGDTTGKIIMNVPYKNAYELKLNETILGETDLSCISLRSKQIKTIGIQMLHE